MIRLPMGVDAPGHNISEANNISDQHRNIIFGDNTEKQKNRTRKPGLI